MELSGGFVWGEAAADDRPRRTWALNEFFDTWNANQKAGLEPYVANGVRRSRTSGIQVDPDDRLPDDLQAAGREADLTSPPFSPYLG